VSKTLNKVNHGTNKIRVENIPEFRQQAWALTDHMGVAKTTGGGRPARISLYAWQGKQRQQSTASKREPQQVRPYRIKPVTNSIFQ